MVVHVSCKPGHCYKFSPSPNTGDFCWSSNFVSALSSSQSNKKERIEAETEINTLCCCPPIFCVDFLICWNCRMYLFNLQSYLKNYTLCTPYPPMIVPCWCASYLSKLLNVFVSIEKCVCSICKIISTINTLCYSSIHQSLFHQFLPQTFCVDWKVFFCQRKFKFYAKDQSFMHCFGRRGLWNELWCLGKHGEPVFTTIQTSAKTKSLPDNDDDGYHYCHAFVTIFK